MDNEVKIRNLIKALQMFPMEASVICVDDITGRQSSIMYIYYNEETNQIVIETGGVK